MYKASLIHLFSFSLFSIFSQMPDFQPVEKMIANQAALTVDGHASPEVVDWDGDGKKDLLVGQFSGSSIRLYLNSGLNSSPVLTDFSYLQADGKNLKTSAG